MSQKDNQNAWQVHEETINRFIQGIAKNMSLYGVTPSIGRLYGVLYFSDDPMTLDDMADTLKMSKTSMSTSVRTLADLKMVESTYRKGIRKDLYQSEEDWYKSFTSLFGNHWRHHTEMNTEVSEEAISILQDLYDHTNDKQLKTKIQNDIDRLAYAQNYYKWLMRVIGAIESGEIFDFIPKEQSPE